MKKHDGDNTAMEKNDKEARKKRIQEIRNARRNRQQIPKPEKKKKEKVEPALVLKVVALRFVIILPKLLILIGTILFLVGVMLLGLSQRESTDYNKGVYLGPILMTLGVVVLISGILGIFIRLRLKKKGIEKAKIARKYMIEKELKKQVSTVSEQVENGQMKAHYSAAEMSHSNGHKRSMYDEDTSPTPVVTITKVEVEICKPSTSYDLENEESSS
ncbi:unnamed protein product [Dimorphilus gyrociliatus]|uniref:Uncharacterized protein n=1 Tax=Dimorphilus gyrociliatus TaxID=2664684 RepID=A0A7I8W7G4_9ANNE|nr:unnamed protein product [Dimorphilus gyrociliatus]